MNKKLLGAVLGSFAIGGLALPVHAESKKPAPEVKPKKPLAPTTADKHGEKEKKKETGRAGGEKSCGGGGTPTGTAK